MFHWSRSYVSIEVTTSSSETTSTPYKKPNRSIAPELLNKTKEVLGKGRFASCIKVYLQGTSVCIKENHDQKVCLRMISIISKEANILSQLSHPAVCFLIGIQINKSHTSWSPAYMK